MRLMLHPFTLASIPEGSVMTRGEGVLQGDMFDTVPLDE
jgi:hypothetical protein